VPLVAIVPIYPPVFAFDRVQAHITRAAQAGCRVLVHAPVRERLLAHLLERVKAVTIGNSLDAHMLALSVRQRRTTAADGEMDGWARQWARQWER
jgi:hypothetical protein